MNREKSGTTKVDRKQVDKHIKMKSCLACNNYKNSVCTLPYRVVYRDSGCESWVNFHEQKK